MIRNLEEILASSRLATENLNSTLEEVHVQLKVKEDEIMRHITSQEKLEKEKSDLQLLNAGLAEKHEMSLQEIENLKETLQSLAADLSNLDKESLNLLSKFDEMNLLYASCFQLVQKERETFSKHAQYQYSELNNKFVVLELEKNATQMKNYELNKTVDELRKVQESTVAQLTEDSRLAAERIQSLVSETETLVSKKKEAEVLISKLEEKVELLLESSRSSDNHVV